MRMVRVREKVFRNSSGFRFNVSFVDCTSVFAKSVLETSLSFSKLEREPWERGWTAYYRSSSECRFTERETKGTTFKERVVNARLIHHCYSPN